MDKKIWLSPPHMTGNEQKFIDVAFDTNWITSAGSNVDGFESDIQNYLNTNIHAVALNSGTSAIHLALKLAGVKRGDYVICQSFTFVATANPICYLGANPIFIDSEKETWNLDPVLVEKAIKEAIVKNKKPKAIIAVHLYGMPYDVDAIQEIAKKYDIPVVEDAAEGLGSLYHTKPCGTLSDFGVFSFNGNKIITTSGGGALLTKSKTQKQKAIFYATQSKDKASHYEHSETGYNYRMSNILAGIGRAQFEVLQDRVNSRRANYNFYKTNLSEIKTISFLEEPKNLFSNRWLTSILFDSFEKREYVKKCLEAKNIESRPLWKPLHMQPVFKNEIAYVNGVSEQLFQTGLCLPSGSDLNTNELEIIVKIIKQALNDF